MKNPFKFLQAADCERIIEEAFKKASEKASKVFVKGERIEVAKERERARINVVGSVISKRLFSVVKSYPDLKTLPKIYKELLRIYISEGELANILASISWTARKIKELKKIYLKKLRGAKTSYEARNVRREFYGRVASLLKKIKKDSEKLAMLQELKKLPDFEETFTIVLAGLPNVGKSSLLWRLTGSKPKIRNYSFTTQGLMLGYIEERGKRIQVIDTPGLLDRPLEKRNKIERKAIAVLKTLADLVIFVFDVSGGLSVKEQENLFFEIKKFFAQKNEMIVVANKIDIANENILEHVKKYSPILVSCKTGEGVEKLKTEILKFVFYQRKL